MVVVVRIPVKRETSMLTILQRPVHLPDGYALVRVRGVNQASYLLVFCLATGRYVGNRRHYATQRASVVAARRSAFMVAYNRIISQAA